MEAVSQLRFKSPPVMLAAWPGLADVGILAIDYLRRQIGAEAFAEIDMSPFVTPESAVISAGVARLPDTPDSVFHYHYDPDLIVFESGAQVSGRDGIEIVRAVLDFARQYGVTRIYTADAMPLRQSHSDPSRLFGVANSRGFLAQLEGYGVSPVDHGRVRGLSGVLLGLASSMGIDAACIMPSIPSYAGPVAYPKAALVVLSVLEALLNVRLDHLEIEEAAAEADTILEAIEGRIRERFPSVIRPHDDDAMHDEQVPPEDSGTRVPRTARNRIEHLFDEVAHDRSKAMELKRELDRWGLYDEYEDRFLDLFRHSRKDGND
ncbi:MAG: hypothetical protein GF331_09015 [Chitinivibrionales bacterium]|nr:hypothetical protein [Chitinivibrionales bacterium]